MELICECKKPLTGVNPDDDQDAKCSRCGFEIMDVEEINEGARKLGKTRGEATKRKYGKKHYSEIGKKGMLKRWNKALVTNHLEEKV